MSPVFSISHHACLMVRQKPGEACHAPTVKFGRGWVRIWGWLQQGWYVWEGQMNQAEYQVILEENLRPPALTVFPNWGSGFPAGQFSSYLTARSIKTRMESHKIKIKTPSWPARSPDPNPTEKHWDVIQRKTGGHKPSNEVELIDLCTRSGIKSREQCERLVESMPRRMSVVNKCQGYSTDSTVLIAELFKPLLVSCCLELKTIWISMDYSRSENSLLFISTSRHFLQLHSLKCFCGIWGKRCGKFKE